MSEISDRLFQQLHASRDRNIRATFATIEAAGMVDTVGNVRLRDAGTVDRFVREHVEGAICWRNPHAGSPEIRRRASL